MSSKPTKEEVRHRAESDLYFFIQLIHKGRVLGHIHRQVIKWWERPGASSHQLLLLPRDHQKSALVAYRVAWEITRNPSVRILYLSSTSNLAHKQLKFIKDILTSDTYRFYWPEMVKKEESQREKWTESEISVDHPIRQAEAVRDPTIFTGGLTTNIVGLHCDVSVFDDVVVPENAYTEDGRERVRTQYSLLASIEGGNARQWVVGTRYHPNDLYNDMITMKVEKYDKDGNIEGEYDLYEKFEAQVENRGDGTGEYLWPRQQRYDGKWFGFDRDILARKRAAYLDKTQFRAQYYNDPNDISEASISPEYFQYYDRAFIFRRDGKWYFKGHRLNVFAAIDFAFSLRKEADYTSIVVVGVDSLHNYYILDIDRFKSGVISEYFEHLLALHRKWDFRKLRAEITVAQEVIVNDLKDNYIRPHGLAISIETFRPTRNEGTKLERIESALQPRYANRQIWHYEGGLCQTLEEELVMRRPPHDDIKDALASCIEICIPPSESLSRGIRSRMSSDQLVGSSRFGGIL